MVIQFDFDGTLALGDNTSIQKMYPNTEAINLCNRLFLDGNTINVCTARGTKSCGSVPAREAKYRQQITDWLKINKVKYHNLSFNKDYADLYIDDRAHNVDHPITYQNLDRGFTTNAVRRLNDKVIKNTINARQEKEWYAIANTIGIKTPKVFHVDNDTLSLEFINGNHNIDLIQYTQILSKFKDTPPHDPTLTHETYIQRIENHLKKNKKIIGRKKLISLLQKETIPPSFNHGDFSIHNLINTGQEIFNIDPIFGPGIFQSYQIDIGKNLFSILFYLKDHQTHNTAMKMYLDTFGATETRIRTIMAAEAVRVATHNKPYADIASNLIASL